MVALEVGEQAEFVDANRLPIEIVLVMLDQKEGTLLAPLLVVECNFKRCRLAKHGSR